MAIAARIVQKQNNQEMLRRALERIVQLYTDKAHFVYELLQNAEDARATKISFHQYEDRLEVLHDGRPFTETNLAGLCDIGKSDKINDLNQIGEFGVGFKSVFGICETVKLYSHPTDADVDYERFAIEIVNFTHPQDIPDVEIEKGYTTKFVFPYCVGKAFSGYNSISALNTKLSERLQNLGITTLLFMKNLKYIEYSICLNNIETSGCYMLEKENINDHCALVSAIGEKEHDEENISYLIFSRPIRGIQQGRTIDIAFALNADNSGQYNFIETKHPYISVYFPTETESKLKFIVQGPYRTTPNRSSIPMDDNDNIELAHQTSKLLRDSVNELKTMDKLNMSLLNILPVDVDVFENSPLFECLYDMTELMVKEDYILPCVDGEFATIYDAKISRGKEFANIITSELLTELIDDGNDYHWLPTYLTETNQEYSTLYNFLVGEMCIDVFRPENMRDYFNENPQFLRNRTDKWLVSFYNMYSDVRGAFSKDRYGVNMLTAEIVKTDEGEFIAPYRVQKKDNRLESKYIPNVFLPTREGTIIKNVHFVDSYMLEHCPAFFKDILALEEPNEYEFFKKSFETRSGGEIPENEHVEDIHMLMKFSNDNRYRDEVEILIQRHLKIRCIHDGNVVYRSPYRLSIYFSKSDLNCSIEHYFLNVSKIYIVDEKFYEANGITREMLRSIGVIEDISIGGHITKGEYETYAPGRNPEWHTYGEYRWRLDLPDIVGVLDYIITNPTAPDAMIKSSFIMKFLLSNEAKLNGTVYIGGSVRSLTDEPSRILSRLISSAKWLYNDSLELVSAEEISKRQLSTMLYGELKKDSNVYELLGFKKSFEDELEEAAGEYSELSEERQKQFAELYLRKNFGITLDTLMDNYSGTSNSTNTTIDVLDYDYDFPSSKIRNIESLRRHVAEVLYFAKPVQYEKVVRSIRTSKNENAGRDYLRGMYRILGTTKYACQMCHSIVDSFVASQLEPNPEEEISSNNLCLCPNCAMEYKQLRNNEQYMNEFFGDLQSLSDYDLTKEPVELYLNGKSIWFTQTHVAEIREYLNLKSEVTEKESPTENKENIEETINECPSSVDKVEIDAKTETSNLIGKRIYHNKKRCYGIIESEEEGKIAIRFDGDLDSKSPTKYSLDICIKNKLIEILND